MELLRTATVGLIIVLLGAACGSTAAEPQSSNDTTSEPAPSPLPDFLGDEDTGDITTTDDSDAEGSCEGFSMGDPCINEENLARCREMVAQCSGGVAVLESCPLQFDCE